MADGVELGTAYVSVVPEGSKWKSGVQGLVDDFKSGLKSGSEQAGTESSSSFGKNFVAGMGGHGRSAAATLSEELLGQADRIGSQFGGQIGGSLTSALTGSSRSAVTALEGVSEAGVGLGGAVAIGAGAAVLALGTIVTAAAGVVKGLFDIGTTFEDAANSVTARTGLMGGALADVMSHVDNVAKTTASSIGSIANVAGQVTQSMHLQGDTMETVTKQISDYDRMNKDAPLNVRAFGEAVNNFHINAKDVPAVLDQLNTAVINTGLPINTLVQDLAKGGSAAQQLGLNFGDSANLLSSFEQAGLNVQKVAPELSTALKNLSEGIGGPTSAFYRPAVKDTVEGLKSLITEIENLHKAGKDTGTYGADSLALHYFGARGGADILAAIEDGTLSAQSLNAELGKTGPTIEAMGDATLTFSDKLTILKNKLEVLLKPVATKILDIADTGLTDLSDWVTKHQPEVIGFFTNVGVAAVDFAEGLTQRIGMAIEALGHFTNAITDVYSASLKVDSFLQRITAMPGSGGDAQRAYADQLSKQADAVSGMGDKMVALGQKMEAVHFDKAAADIKSAGDAAAAAAGEVHGLGDAVLGLPASKSLPIDVPLSVNGQAISPQDFFTLLSGGSGGSPVGGSPLSGPTGAPTPSGAGGAPSAASPSSPMNPLTGPLTSQGVPGNTMQTLQQLYSGGGGGGNAYQGGANPGGAAPSGFQGGGGSPRDIVHQAMLTAGFGEDQWPALNNLMMHESGFNPTAHNPSGAYGMFQFMPYTWPKYGAQTNDPATQAQYGLQYIKDRYGSPAAAWAQYFNHAGGEGSYATGGAVDTVPAWLTPGEHVLTTDDVKALGGQQGVYALRKALGHDSGGAISPGGGGQFNPTQDRWLSIWNDLAKAGIDYPLSKAPYGPAMGNQGFENDQGKVGAWNQSGDFGGRPSSSDKNQIPMQSPDYGPMTDVGSGWKGGLWPYPFAEGGAVDPALIKQLQDQGILPPADQNLPAGTPSGTPIMPGPKGAQGQQQGQQGQSQDPYAQIGPAMAARTLGFIPAVAGHGGAPGTSTLSGVFNLGAEVINSAIEQGGQMASQAISMAAAAGGAMAGGGGAAAGPAAGAAANFAIGIGTKMAERGVSYGAQMLGIGSDALLEIMSPFGLPRWMGYNYTSFVPNLGPVASLGVSSAEKALQEATKGPQESGQQAGGPVSPQQLPGQGGAQGSPSGTQAAKSIAPPPGESKPKGWMDTNAQSGPGAPPSTVGHPGGGGAPPPAKPSAPSGVAGATNLLDPLNMLGFDSGGMLPAGGMGVNMTSTPEPVFTDSQWQSLNAAIPEGSSGGHNFGVTIQNLYATDAGDVKRQIDSQQKLAMLRYSGRP